VQAQAVPQVPWQLLRPTVLKLLAHYRCKLAARQQGSLARSASSPANPLMIQRALSLFCLDLAALEVATFYSQPVELLRVALAVTSELWLASLWEVLVQAVV
jgi:hypothetical protein